MRLDNIIVFVNARPGNPDASAKLACIFSASRYYRKEEVLRFWSTSSGIENVSNYGNSPLCFKILTYILYFLWATSRFDN